MHGSRYGAATTVAAVIGVALGVAACSDRGTGEQAQRTTAGQDGGGTIVLGLRRDVESLNPYLSIRSGTRDIAFKIFARLAIEQADFGQGPPSFTPSLATAWRFSEDGRSLTFDLRPDAVWSDGVPITANDVRFTWNASIDPALGWLGAESKNRIEDVVIDAPHQVTFVFSESYPYQMMDANDGPILPEHIWGKIPTSEWRTAGLDRQPVCSGPFEVGRWVPGQSIELVPNERYWDEAVPRVDRVIFRITPDAASGMEQLLAGEIDFWDGVQPADLQRVDATPGVDVRRYTDRYVALISWNTRRAFFSDSNVRRALTLAIDRQRIVDDLLLGTGMVASGPFPPLFQMQDPDMQALPHDPAAARKALARAGWRDSDGDGWRDRDGERFSFDLAIRPNSTLDPDTALLVQEDLKKIGVEARPRLLESSVIVGQVKDGTFDAWVTAFRLPTKVDLAVMFKTEAARTGVNYGHYSNPELDRLLSRADSSVTSETALPLYRQALRIVQDDAPSTFLYWRDRLVGFSSRVHDAHPNAQSPLFDLDAWWVDPSSR
ncbi:MAG: ABC transporter substrate-binding protein [Acidobacteriota bacterium]